MGGMETLPFVDEHAQVVDADVATAWGAVEGFVRPWVRRPAPALLARAWGLEPASGFAIAETRPNELLSLRGRHRFSRYQLDFALEPLAGDRTRVRAVTRAVFPGPHGRAYRAAVIGTRMHVLVTRRMLRRIAARAAPR